MPTPCRTGTSRFPSIYPTPASPVTATHCRSGYASLAAIAPASPKPSVEMLPQPRNPLGISVSYTVLSWSRVFPESCVTNEFIGSSAFIMSPKTRYGLMGFSSEAIASRYFASPASRDALTAAATPSPSRAPPPVRSDTPSASARRVNLASPSTA